MNKTQTIGIKLLNSDARVPEYATSGSACFDIVSTSETTQLMPYSAATLQTGLAFELPENHVMLVFSRSGHGFKQGVRLANCVGVIDSDYRGELMIKLKNDSTELREIKKGERCAQGVVIPVTQVHFVQTDELSDTARGSGGFGSTGN